MKKIFQLFIVYIIIISSAFAQTKQLTIEDAVSGIFRKFYSENYKQYKWRGNSDNLTFVEKNEINEMPINGKPIVILKLEDLNKAISGTGITELKIIMSYSWLDYDNIIINSTDGTLIYNLKSKKLTATFKNQTDAENQDLCIATLAQSFTVKNNLFIIDKNAKITHVTNDKNESIVNGKSVHRQEFGIEKGTFWSPKGNLLAFYRMDESMVTDYPLVNINERIATVSNTKYPMAGMKSHHVTLGVYDIKTSKTIFLQTGEPAEQYLTNITWGPEEKYIYIAVLNREQNHMKFNQYEVATGKFIKTIFEEKHDKYVEPQHVAIFMKSKPNQFLWQSQRDGFNHIYLYNTDGKLINQVSKGKFVVTEILGMDKKEENIFVEATLEKRQIETHLFKISISSDQMTKITKKEGTHDAELNSSGTYLVDNYSSLKVPMMINVLSTDGTVNKTIYTAKDPLKDYKLGKLDVFTVKSADNKTDLFCATIKPTDFDATKKYPLILYVYGGPHAQMINDKWLAGQDLWKFYMAQKGYVVMIVDNRGSANRGLEFENVIHRNLGVNEMADQVKAVKTLINQNYIDTTRIGVHGWSYGGFMTTSLLANYPEIFKVGVAGGPVIDWKYYEIMYGERYMDTPDDNPEGYKNTSLLLKAKNIKGKLLIIHGYMDPTVVLQNSLDFIQKSIEAGVLVDYFIYPNAEHNVRGADRIHLMRKVTQYFDDFLLPVK